MNTCPGTPEFLVTPLLQVGAVIVNDRQRVVGVGHNSMPYRCGNRLDWAWPTDSKLHATGGDTVRMDTKYPYGTAISSLEKIVRAWASTPLEH